MLKLAENGRLRRRLGKAGKKRSRGYTWPGAAQAYNRLYARASARSSTGTRSKK
jgi:hypothetical protein